jgi:hypothetical protein
MYQHKVNLLYTSNEKVETENFEVPFIVSPLNPKKPTGIHIYKIYAS